MDVIGSMFILEWISMLPVAVGVFEITIQRELICVLTSILFLSIFYVSQQTSLLVENEDIGWQMIRHMSRVVMT